MRFNLRYVIPVMCGTCIALTVTVAAAVGGTDGETAPAKSEVKSSVTVLHAGDFTAYPADIDGGSSTEDMSGEALPESLEEDASADVLSESLEENMSADVLPESLEDDTSVEALPESPEGNMSAEALPEISEENTSAEALPEITVSDTDAEILPETEEPDKLPAAADPVPETDKPADETVQAGYDEPQRQAMLETVNAVRAEYGLPPLYAMAELSDAAQTRARECAGYFSHTRPSGAKWHTILEEKGLKRNVRAENIAYYYPTASQALNSWMSDYSHRANILNGQAVYIGIGYYNDGYSSYWVQLFLGEN